MSLRLVRQFLAFAALISLGVLGVNNVTSWPDAQNAAQRVATVVAVGCGLIALASAVALWRRAAVLRLLLFGCVVTSAAAAGLATWAWGKAPLSAWLPATVMGAALGAVAAWLAWPPRAHVEQAVEKVG